MKFRLAILWILILVGCNTTRERILGTYEYQFDFENYGYLRLEPSNRFTFDCQQGLARIGTKGNWEVNDNYLILNSDLEPTEQSHFLKKGLNHSDSIIVNIFWKTWHQPDKPDPIPGAIVKITNNGLNKEFRTDENGIARIPKGQIDSLIVSSIGLLLFENNIDSTLDQDIDIILVEDSRGNTSFKNDTFLIQGRKLIEKKEGHKIVYKK